jgi:hypothetical protein
MKITVFSGVTPCSLAGSYKHAASVGFFRKVGIFVPAYTASSAKKTAMLSQSVSMCCSPQFGHAPRISVREISGRQTARFIDPIVRCCRTPERIPLLRPRRCSESAASPRRVCVQCATSQATDMQRRRMWGVEIMLLIFITNSMEPQVAQLLKNFPSFYGTRRFITGFTRARHWSLSWARSIQFMSPHPLLYNGYRGFFLRG